MSTASTRWGSSGGASSSRCSSALLLTATKALAGEEFAQVLLFPVQQLQQTLILEYALATARSACERGAGHSLIILAGHSAIGASNSRSAKRVGCRRQCCSRKRSDERRSSSCTLLIRRGCVRSLISCWGGHKREHEVDNREELCRDVSMTMMTLDAARDQLVTNAPSLQQQCN